MNPDSIVRLRVDRFALADIFGRMDVRAGLMQINFMVVGIHSTDKLLDRFLDLIFGAIPATRGAILLVGRDPEQFEFSTYRGDPFEVDLDLAAEVLRERNAMMSTEDESFLLAPLRVFTNTFGVVCLENPEPVTFTTAHFHLLIAAAVIAAIKLEDTLFTERLEAENRRLHEEIDRLHGIVGNSECMARVDEIIDRVSSVESTVLIWGETGTGKELAARAIHRKSTRRNKPFIEVNCAAIPDSLVESEFFGHQKGAFTGAHTQQIGKIEAADEGTLFLDEIGEMSLAAQAVLLRVLQEKEFQRIGSTRTIKVDIRVIAATNRNLEERVKDGRFRADLLYRLKVIALQMPPLRQRCDDIPMLTDYFVQKFSDVRIVSGVTPESRRLLAAYDWPGNVRELQNIIEHAVVMGKSEFIQAEDLPQEIRTWKHPDETGGSPDARGVQHTCSLIERKLVETHGNVARAARILKFSASYIYKLIREGKVRRP